MAISIQLDAEIQQRLNKLVALTGRTKSDLLHGLIQSGLDDLEDLYLADATMGRVRKGTEKLLNSIQVRRALGLNH
jgi:RHH-type transcriptional regulator, rel operon repressor / antitoxin RelB